MGPTLPLLCLKLVLTAEPSALHLQLEQLRDGEGLRLQDIEEAAERTSLEGAATDALVQAADAERDRTLENFLPRLSVTARAAKLSPADPQSLGNLVVAPMSEGPVTSTTQLVSVPFSFKIPDKAIGLSAGLTIPLSDYALRLIPAHRALTAARDAQAQDAVAARRRARQGSVQLFFAQLRAEVGVGVTEHARQLAQSNLEAAQKRLAAGSRSRAEVAALEAQVARSEQWVVTSRDGARLLALRLATLVHGPAAHLKENLVDPLPAQDDIDVAALTQQAISTRAEMKALDERKHALEAQAQIQRAGYFPRLDASAEASYANPNLRYFPPPDEFRFTWQIGAQLTWSVTDVLQAKSGARVSESNVTALGAQRAALVDQLTVEVFEAAQRVQSVESQLNACQRALKAAEESMRARRILFDVGSANATELLDAQNTLIGAEFAELEARIEQRRSRRLLQLVIGS